MENYIIGGQSFSEEGIIYWDDSSGPFMDD